MAAHIGIVGVSAEGAALCYRTLCIDGAQILGRHDHPEVSMHTLPLARYMPAVEAGDWQAVGELMLVSAGKLAAAGADLLICPDNTVHQAWEAVAPAAPLPWIHIADPVIESAVAAGRCKLGVLGTRYLMEGPVYRERLAAAGIGCEIPPATQRAEIDRLIFDDLVHGRFDPSARRYFCGVIEKLAAAGCDGVVLGCTEIPLLVSPADSVLPTLDSTRLLARAALTAAVSASAGR